MSFESVCVKVRSAGLSSRYRYKTRRRGLFFLGTQRVDRSVHSSFIHSLIHSLISSFVNLLYGSSTDWTRVAFLQPSIDARGVKLVRASRHQTHGVPVLESLQTHRARRCLLRRATPHQPPSTLSKRALGNGLDDVRGRPSDRSRRQRRERRLSRH